VIRRGVSPPRRSRRRASGSPRRSERKIGKGACDGSISLPSASGADGSTAGSRSTSSICTAPIPKKRRIAVRAGDTARPATRTIAITSARTKGRRGHDAAGSGCSKPDVGCSRQVGCRRHHDRAAQLAKLPLEVTHRLGAPSASVRGRGRASTSPVPLRTPSTSAVSASPRSRKKRQTTARPLLLGQVPRRRRGARGRRSPSRIAASGDGGRVPPGDALQPREARGVRGGLTSACDSAPRS
jgi:hypothetical protein